MSLSATPVARLVAGLILAALLAAPAVAEPQRGSPPGTGPRVDMRRDMEVFHFLLENHKDIRRTVKNLKNGVETLTESDRPEVAKKIQEHVPAMYKRMKAGHPVRRWDPLFAEMFEYTDQISMKIENTKKGVRVTSTSEVPRAVKLIQAHAEVLNSFVEKGFAEAHKEHPVPNTPRKK